MKLGPGKSARLIQSATLVIARTVVLLLVATSVGCRNNAAQRDAYIRELRMQEDQIYELQDYMNEYQQLLCEQRKENARLRAQLAGDKRPPESADDRDETDDNGRSLLDRPRLERRGPGDTEELPDIDFGEPTMPEVDLGEPVPGGELEELPGAEPDNADALDDLSQATGRHSAELASASYDPRGGEVRSAVFAPPIQPTQPATSCAIYAEQMPLEPGASDDSTSIGLMAIVEPLTADGSAGYFVGEVSLMLVDPLASDEDWEISRWDYTPEEVEQAWRDNSRRVLDLPLAAPSTTPLGRPLELWVRLVPADEDRKVLCSTAVTLADPVGLIGVPVSGGTTSTDPAALVTTGWTAADELRTQTNKEPVARNNTWQAATRMPPPAVAKAEASSTAPGKKLAKRVPDWSPFRK